MGESSHSESERTYVHKLRHPPNRGNVLNRKWRRRESNPQSDFSKGLPLNDFGDGHSSQSVNRSQSLTANGHRHGLAIADGAGLALVDRYPALGRVVQAWSTLPIHLRESILTLVDAAALLSFDEGAQS